MKKYLSLILAVMMVLSCVSYAAPVAVGTVQTANEADVEVSELFEADLTQETSVELTHKDYGTLAYYVDFDVAKDTILPKVEFKSTTGTASYKQFTTVSVPELEGMPATVELEAYGSAYKTDGDALVMVGQNYPRWWFAAYGEDGSSFASFPEGTYTVEYEAKGDIASKLNNVVAVFGNPDAWTNQDWVANAQDMGKFTDSYKVYTATFDYDGSHVINKDGTKVSGSNSNGFNDFSAGLQKIGLYSGSGADYKSNSRYYKWAKIWYKPIYYTVSFENTNGVLPSVEIAKGGKFVPTEYAPATLPDSASAFLGWSLTKGGKVVTEPLTVTQDITLYAVYDIETVGKYGKLAYFVDFDVASGTVAKSIGTGTPISDLTTVSVPALEGMPANVKIEGYSKDYQTDGESLIVTANGKYPRWFMTAYDESNTKQLSTYPVGIYTLEWCSTTDNSTATQNDLVINGTNLTLWGTNNLGSVKGLHNTVNEFKVFTGTVVYDGQHAYKENGAKVVHGSSQSDDLSGGLARIGVYCSSSTEGAKRSYSWAKLWYAPLTINLSFDANGKDITVPETALVSSRVDSTKLYKPEACGTSRFIGWSETKDGKILTGEKLYTEDTTLYAIWDDNFCADQEEAAAGTLAFHVHYNNSGAANLQSNLVNYATIGEAYDKLFVGHTESKAWLQGAPNANVTYTPYYGYIDKENTSSPSAVKDFKHPDNAFVINAHRAATNYPKLHIGGAGGHLADGIYTLYAEVSVTDTENVKAIQYNAFARVVPDDGSKEGDQALDSSVLPMDGNTYYIKKVFYVKDGVFGGYENMNNKYLVNQVKSTFGFNFDITQVDKTQIAKATIVCDNFKVYYREYDYAPLSYKENSIRVSTPSGIRFRASVSDNERSHEELKEYGFIVARKAVLDEANLSAWQFTQESDVKFAKGAAYGNVDGKDVDKIFATEKGRTFYTAVVYNIPADRYDDDIVVRPYIVIGDKVVYGSPMVNNIRNVAQAIKDSADYETYKYAIDNILAGKEI